MEKPQAPRPEDALGSYGALLDTVLQDAAERLDGNPIDWFEMHRQEDDPLADTVEKRTEVKELLAKAGERIDRMHEGFEDAATRDAAVEETDALLTRVGELQGRHVYVVTVHGNDSVLLYWDWRYGYTIRDPLEHDPRDEETGLDVDRACRSYVNPRHAIATYEDAVVHVNPEYCLQEVGGAASHTDDATTDEIAP